MSHSITEVAAIAGYNVVMCDIEGAVTLFMTLLASYRVVQIR